MRLHDNLKSLVNSVAGLVGARLVGAHWGPRGVFDMLRRAQARGFSPALVFDVGASNGQWTRECRKILADAHYVLVDPLQANRSALSVMECADQRTTVWYGVAAASAGNLPFYDHGDQSSILRSDDFPGPVKAVEATTVDALYQSLSSPRPVLLKADVQGYELEVLKGATTCLKSAEMLILEVSFRKIYKDSPLADEIIAYLRERGFHIYEICSYLQRSTDHDLLQSDLVFVHESSALFGKHGWT